MNDLFSDISYDDNKEFPKVSIEDEGKNDHSIIEENLEGSEDKIENNLFEIFTNLNYPSCPEKLEKINLDKLLNISSEMDSKENINDNNLDSNFNIITTHSFNTYSVSSCLNKIKFLKNLKEENSKFESTYKVNTPSSENVQKSNILVTEDLDSLIKNVKSMPFIPKLQKINPISNIQSSKNDDNSINKKKRKNKRKRRSDRDRYYKEYMEDSGDRSPKSRKLISPITKNWDDIAIEEYNSFDVEDKENSFESILSQYNSMKQPPKDILVISKFLNEPTHSNTSNENNSNTENMPQPLSPKSNEQEEKILQTSVTINKSKSDVVKTMSESSASSLNKVNENTNTNGKELFSNKQNKNQNVNTNKSLIENDNNNELIIKLKELNKDSSDIWNKNSPISSTSSNSSLSNMSDEEISYPQNLHLKKHKLESLRYSSILTPPTPPQPIEEN